MSIHRTIREVRERLKMTELQFADAIGVTRAAVQQWEREGGTAPARSRQKKVADLLGLSIAELMEQPSDTSRATVRATGTGVPPATTQSPAPAYSAIPMPPKLSDRALDMATAYDAITDSKRKRDVYIRCIAIIEDTDSQSLAQEPKQTSGTGA